MRRPPREKLTIRLEPELVQLLKAMKLRRRVSLNEIIAQIIRDKLTGTGAPDNRRALTRRLDVLTEAQDVNRALLERQRLRLELFIQSVFALLPPTPDDERAACGATGAERYQNFRSELYGRIEEFEQGPELSGGPRADLFAATVTRTNQPE